MSDKMHVIFASQTGHVLAAFTRTADPEGKVKIAELTGDSLPVRRPDRETVYVRPEALDTAVVDFEPDVFRSPSDFVVGGGVVVKLGAASLNPAAQGTPIPPADPPPSTISPPLVYLTASRAAVRLDADADAEKGVCVVLQEKTPAPGEEREWRVAQGAVAANSHFVVLDWKTNPDSTPASVPAGKYTALALVAGFRPLFVGEIEL